MDGIGGAVGGANAGSMGMWLTRERPSLRKCLLKRGQAAKGRIGHVEIFGNHGYNGHNLK